MVMLLFILLVLMLLIFFDNAEADVVDTVDADDVVDTDDADAIVVAVYAVVPDSAGTDIAVEVVNTVDTAVDDADDVCAFNVTHLAAYVVADPNTRLID